MQLTASDTLVFYDPELPIILTTDASDVGISAVITFRYSDNTERPWAGWAAAHPQNFGWVGHNAFGPTNNSPVAYVR